MKDQYIHLQCACLSPDHVARVHLEVNIGACPQLSVQPMLNPHRSFWRRLCVAFRYLFNCKSAGTYWGGWQFDDVILTKVGAEDLTKITTRYNLLMDMQDFKERHSEAQ